MNHKTSLNLISSFIRAPGGIGTNKIINGLKGKGILLKEYGESLDNLIYDDQMSVPMPEKSQVLIKVKSTSINPLDNVMRRGYASSIVDLKLGLPFILGRECSGEIIEIGENVWNFEIGDQVISATAPFSNGSHCEYVLIDESEITYKPSNLTHEQSASIPYASLTAWNSVFDNKHLITPDKRILVNGGNGSVGYFLIQLLKKHHGVNYVVASSNPTHFDKLINAGVDGTVDYKLSKLSNTDNEYDIVFNCFDGGDLIEKKCIDALKDGGTLIGFNGPLVKTSDQQGILKGLPTGLINQYNSSDRIMKQYSKNINLQYSLFSPSSSNLEQITKLYESNQFSTNIDKQQFNLKDIKNAYNYFENSNPNGKVIINV